MNKFLLLSLTLLCYTKSIAQTSQTIRYYKTESVSKEVEKEKANFSETVTTMPDVTITKEVTDLKQNIIIRSSSFKGEEPVGIWLIRNSSGGMQTLDYAFDLVYTDKKCEHAITDTTVMIKNYFSDLDSVGYVAPKLKGPQTNIISFLVNKTIYPSYAMQRGIQGTSYITFIINREGNVEDIKVWKSSHVMLDKEAVRVIRQMQFFNPPMLNGKPQRVCFVFPLTFTIDSK